MSARAEALDLSQAKRLGVFGGSFDPVHAGHLHVARAAESAFELDHVVFVPAARPPHKPERVLARGCDRVAMLELALAGASRWSISELELGREGPSYTFDTVRALPGCWGLAPDVRLHLLIGWDNLRGLEHWHRPTELLDLVQPIVILRGEDDPALLELLRDVLGEACFARLERGLLRTEPVPFSSTDLRGRLCRGEDPGEELAAGVLEYLRERGIYGSTEPA